MIIWLKTIGKKFYYKNAKKLKTRLNTYITE